MEETAVCFVRCCWQPAAFFSYGACISLARNGVLQWTAVMKDYKMVQQKLNDVVQLPNSAARNRLKEMM